jgi:multiple sugar transport system permease protein
MATSLVTGGPSITTSAGTSAPQRGRRDRRHAYGFLAPSVLGLAIFTVFPTVMALFMSLYNWPVFGDRSFIGLTNYGHLLTDRIFLRVIGNTFLFVVLYVPLNVIVSLGLAMWLGPRMRGRRIFRVVFFIPVVTPMVANAMVWRLVYQPGGLIDATTHGIAGVSAPNFLGSSSLAMLAVVVMSVWQGFGYNFLVFSAALDALPGAVLEAAEMDGAVGARRFWHVTLPMITPSIFFATTMTLITSFQVFAQPFILTGGGPGAATQTLVMFVYNEGWQFLHMGLAAAAAWILFVIIMGLTAVQFLGQRKWVNYDV